MDNKCMHEPEDKDEPLPMLVTDCFSACAHEMKGRTRTVMYISFSAVNCSAPAVSKTSIYVHRSV